MLFTALYRLCAVNCLGGHFLRFETRESASAVSLKTLRFRFWRVGAASPWYDSKSVVPFGAPGVRIPLSPPYSLQLRRRFSRRRRMIRRFKRFPAGFSPDGISLVRL